MAAHSQADSRSYDIILVGAGTASCLLASRLSQRLPDHRILILEAGSHLPHDQKVLTPGLSRLLWDDPTYDWGYVTAPEPELGQREIRHPRGRLVGGSSAINSHSVVFPGTEWHDRIAQGLLTDEGHDGWLSEDMKEYYQRWHGETPAGTSFDNENHGRVLLSYPHALDMLQTKWLEAFQSLGCPPNDTGFDKSAPGAVTIANAIDSAKGERSHAGAAFLEPVLNRGNVVLETNAYVEKIVFGGAEGSEGDTLSAKGVQYVKDGQHHVAMAECEVVLCAGAFGSPQILQRSGIGPKGFLSAANISVVLDLPGVGENLQDHLNCGISIEVQDNIHTLDEASRNPEMKKAASTGYEQHRTGPLATGTAFSFAFAPLQLLQSGSEDEDLLRIVKTHVEDESDPSLRAQYKIIQEAVNSPVEATATLFMLRRQRHPEINPAPLVDGNYMTIVAMLSHPFSRGHCHITSPSPFDPPDIRFNYLSHPLDVEILARHMLQIERLLSQPTFSSITKENGKRLPLSYPYPLKTLTDAKSMLPICVTTNYHPCGTCSMMRRDLGGVVDENLSVYGTRNLRVCDASVLPIIPRGNILTSVYAVAEKGADIIVNAIQGS